MRAIERARVLILTLFAVFAPRIARADTAFVVVSERSAPDVVEGARVLGARTRGAHRVQVRTVEQVREGNDAALLGALRDVRVLLLLGVFGEEAERFQRLLTGPLGRAPDVVLAVGGDPRLSRLSRVRGARIFAGVPDDAMRAIDAAFDATSDVRANARTLAGRYRTLAPFLTARAYWHARSAENTASLVAYALSLAGVALQVPEPAREQVLAFELDGRVTETVPSLAGARNVVAVIDYDLSRRASGAALHDALRAALEAKDHRVLRVFAKWGRPSIEALSRLAASGERDRLAAVIVLQDFVIGAGGGYVEGTRHLGSLGVPVIAAIRSDDRSETAWRLSEDGLSSRSVHYRVAMRELQGQSQPFVVAAAGAPSTDAATGARFRVPAPVVPEIEALVRRIARFRVLRERPNGEKRVAIIYYDHPPGRHNIGADNLDVPASLHAILGRLEREGYDVGDVPRTQEALLEVILARGVNLPRDRAALAAVAREVPTLSREAYARYFATLPETARASVSGGPLALLGAQVRAARTPEDRALAEKLVTRVLSDVRHFVNGSRHPEKARVLALLERYEASVHEALAGRDVARALTALVRELEATGMPGLRGWGESPGTAMVSNGHVVLPSLTYGNVMLAPQPPRGWEVDDEQLHANLAFAPTHQYLAFYHYVRDVFRADVVVHVGRHSTYEFLPGPRVGLSAEDFPRIVLGDLPSVYLYIVDGVGEGIQAKRRGHAVIVDHLTPSIGTTPLYDELLGMRQLVETFEASAGDEGAGAMRDRAVTTLRTRIRELDLETALTESMRDELETRGLRYAEVDDDLLVHEVGHFLTRVQEQRMPFGLHVFATPWSRAAVTRMARSMGGGESRALLEASFEAEGDALVHALAGGFVAPGKGNDPIRNPDALPTGRNFHALDGAQIPTRSAHTLGVELATRARGERRSDDGVESIVLWASDTVRDEGTMVSFGLDMLGVTPVWDARGLLRGLARVELTEGRTRRDVSFVTSGLFRDLYPDLLALLDRAVLLALDASSETIREGLPELAVALDAALAPLGELRRPGHETLATNAVARHWVHAAQEALTGGAAPETAGRNASLRVFGNAHGGYGAGINRLAERSAAFRDRNELADVFVHRMGHAYGEGLSGEPVHDVFRSVLARTTHTYLGRASHLYGVLDNNDGYDYLGGLSVAVEHIAGRAPESFVVRNPAGEDAFIEPLAVAIQAELRGRHLNPEVLRALMQHGYAGARTMSTGFVENLWGFQVTNPEVVSSATWEEVREVFLEDAHDIGLDTFLEQGPNAHVKANMIAILLVAAERGYYTPDAATLDALAQDFARLVAANGLPGSGHTDPDHPVMGFVAARLRGEARARFEASVAAARPNDAAQTGGRAFEASVRAFTASPAGRATVAALGVSLALLAAFGFSRGLKGKTR